MVIMGVMLVFAVPNMRGVHERNKLVSAARKIVSLMRYARAEAITSEMDTEIHFKKKKNRYRLNLLKYTEVRGSWDSRESKKRERVEKIQELPQFVTFKEITTEYDIYGREPEPILVFHPDGSATGATIVLESLPPNKSKKEARHMTIELAHSTGLPSVYNKTPEEMERGEGPVEEDYEENTEEDWQERWREVIREEEEY